MTRNSARFGRGSGVYACQKCTRKTRQTGGDNHTVDLCKECYDIAGQENALSDNGPDWEFKELAEKEIARLKALCISKGGKL